MITAGSITAWAGLPVLDRDGSKIGYMEAVYFDCLLGVTKQCRSCSEPYQP